MIRLFGLAIHDAPGEAEAECALLQLNGIVDAVLSEDVDTIMFGCTRTLRNWSAESKGSGAPTHVSMYDVEAMKLAKLGLDREGMVLVALMSGGDYLPEGVPGCGVKIACEAAKGGFGKSLCRLKASATDDIQTWRDSLIHELQINEKGTFRRRHKALAIPEDFPNLEILRYYTHPVVSPESKLEEIREKFHRRRDIHLEGLREFARETFDWDYRIGAIKFIRVLGEALLIRSIIHKGEEAAGYVKRISSRRAHFSTDACPELRLGYVPEEVVPIDLSKEVEEEVVSGRSGLALNSDDDFDEVDNIDSTNSTSAGNGKVFDPSKPSLAWVLESVARYSIPTTVANWETAEAAKARKVPAKKKTIASKAKDPKGMKAGALHQYVRVTKASQEQTKTTEKPLPQESPPKVTRPKNPRRLRMPTPLEPSKLPTPSNSGTTQTTPWTLSSSQPTPRTPKPAGRNVQQAILISSSPVGPESPSPAQRRQPPTSSMESTTSSVYEIFSQNSSQGVNARSKRTKPKVAKASSQETRLKQTSLDLFATKRGDSSTKSITTTKASVTTITKTSAVSGAGPPPDPFESDSDDDLAPLSSLLSPDPPAPTSPSKRRQKSPLPTRSPSPSTKPARKKKLLVPRTSAVGYFKEVEVDVEDRDERLDKEASILQRRSGRSGVTRWSDVTFVDLTGDD